MAREQFGREVGVWMQVPIVQRDTRQEAEAFLNYFAVEHEDRRSVDGWSAGIAAEARSLSNEQIRIARLVVDGTSVALSVGRSHRLMRSPRTACPPPYK